jgi:hypothetical protein
MFTTQIQGVWEHGASIQVLLSIMVFVIITTKYVLLNYGLQAVTKVVCKLMFNGVDYFVMYLFNTAVLSADTVRIQ